MANNARLMEEAKLPGVTLFLDVDGPFAECSGDECFEREFYGKRKYPMIKDRPMQMLLLLMAELKKNYQKLEIVIISSWGKMEIMTDFMPKLAELSPSTLKLKNLMDDVHFKSTGGSEYRQTVVNEHMSELPDWNYLIIDDGQYYDDPNFLHINGWDGLTFTNVITAITHLDLKVGEVAYYKKFSVAKMNSQYHE